MQLLLETDGKGPAKPAYSASSSSSGSQSEDSNFLLLRSALFDENLFVHPNLLVRLVQYLHLRLFNATSYCVICDVSHSIETPKLMPCSSELCQTT